MIVTILTPTYNRGTILEQLYDSLCRQSDKDFEWLIVDDGSTDHTKELCENWCQKADFQVRYVWQKNGGKHRALNRGIPLAQAPFIYIIDSDDYLTDNAMEYIKKWTKNVQKDPKCAGVSGTRINKKGQIIGQYPQGRSYIDATDIRRRQAGLEGDKAEVYRADILKKYPFPEFKGEKFLSECAVWNRIGMDGYYLRWYPEALCVCEYRDDGLTRSENKEIDNYQGYTYVIKQQIGYETKLKRLALIAQYNQITKLKGGNNQMICRNLKITWWELKAAVFAKRFHSFFSSF
ncbi:MAG: glycosyltransferase family 2 protein [Lachnospiraceae bacterium]|jgi:glycosyltransferase involved in cell wall biosynthesis|nr:glycosyltransferase family 2 protein [Lachnospiraceae bacterium]